ncbi:unnamed protein product, partial [Ostreobium quekettii]
ASTWRTRRCLAGEKPKFQSGTRTPLWSPGYRSMAAARGAPFPHPASIATTTATDAVTARTATCTCTGPPRGCGNWTRTPRCIRITNCREWLWPWVTLVHGERALERMT